MTLLVFTEAVFSVILEKTNWIQEGFKPQTFQSEATNSGLLSTIYQFS